MNTETHAVTGSDSATVDFEMPAPGTPGYDEFRKTGKLPSPGDSAPPKAVVPEATPDPESLEEEDSAPSDAVSRADSASAPPQKKKATGDQRKAQINTEIREALRVLAEIKEQTEKLRVPPTSQAAPAKDEAKPETKTGKPQRPPRLGAVGEDGKPVYKTFGEYEKRMEEYEDARDAYIEAQTSKGIDDKLTQTQRQQQVAEAEKVIGQELLKRTTEARKEYADYDTVVSALNTAKDQSGRELVFIPKGSAVDLFFNDSDHSSRVLYYLGQHQDEAGHIFERDQAGNFVLNPIRQVRLLADIERNVSAKPEPKPVLNSPARAATKAPAPPHQVTGKGPAPDPVERAVLDGDFAAFQRAENDKILAARKSSRR